MSIRQLCGAILVALACGLLGGCGWLAAAQQRVQGKSVAAEYRGLADKSLAIVVYVDTATTSEFADARTEITAYLQKQFQSSAGQLNVKLVPREQVLQWQDETDWVHLTQKAIAEHFEVERVLYVEVAQYTTRTGGGAHLIQGRLIATVQVFEAEAARNTPAWSVPMDIKWPEIGPTDVTRTNDTMARKRVLEAFSEKVVNSFFDHREIDKTVREKGGL